MIDILELTGAEFADAARQHVGKGAGIANEIYGQVMREGRFVPESFGASAKAADRWRAAFRVGLPKEVSTRQESHGDDERTEKAILARPEVPDRRYECVRIPMGRGRQSLCVSSQVGCRMGCRFCETGRMGLLDDLSAGEIVGQVVWARARGAAPRSVVFMGMGEPLDNADAVLRALAILHDRQGLDYAQERLTVCTVGHVPGILRLAALGWPRLNLSISLHAANDELRDRLVPMNRKWPLAELSAALVDYRQRSNFQLGVNYCLMPGLNDRREHALEIAEFCRPLGRVMVYLIPFNPGTDPITRVPTEEEIVRFVGWLRDAGLPVRRRITKGSSVMAACGQLGDLTLRRRSTRS